MILFLFEKVVARAFKAQPSPSPVTPAVCTPARLGGCSYSTLHSCALAPQPGRSLAWTPFPDIHHHLLRVSANT